MSIATEEASSVPTEERQKHHEQAKHGNGDHDGSEKRDIP
jgi:hypothetical protein